jgi:RHS repeat-associated protein
MQMFDSNEMASGVNACNNWLDPLFNSSEHVYQEPNTALGSGVQSGNVSQLINTQTFSVYEKTTFGDGSQTRTIQTYDALQRLQQTVTAVSNVTIEPWYDLVSTQYFYASEVSMDQVGTGANGPLAYPSYASLPMNFNKSTEIKVTTYAFFNDQPIFANGQQVVATTTTTGTTYYVNPTQSTAASGISKTYTYYSEGLPCNISPYLSSSTTQPSQQSSLGVLSALTPAQYVTAGQAPTPISNTSTNTTFTVVNGMIVPETQTNFVNGDVQAPVTRTYNYITSSDSSQGQLGQLACVVEASAEFSCTQTMSYSVDSTGNQTVNKLMSYADGTGPTLPITEVVDFLGRPISTTNSLGLVTHCQYDCLGRLTQLIEQANLPGQQLVTTHAYAIANGNSTTTVNTPTGAVITYTYDSMGRQTGNQIQPVGSATPRTIRTFHYGSLTVDGGPQGNQVTSATTYLAANSSVTTDYYYNAMGELIASVPSVGLAQGKINIVLEVCTYVLSFNFTYAPSSIGTNTSPITAYGLASLVQKEPTTGVTANIYNFDSQLLNFEGLSGKNLNALFGNASITANILNSDGSVNLSVMTVENSATIMSYHYDSMFRLVSESLTGNGKTLTTNRSYDSDGLTAQMTDPQGNHFSMSYNSMGGATALTVTPGNGSGTPYTLATAIYNAGGQKLSYANTPSTTPGVNATSYAYDPVTGMGISETDALGNTINYLYYPTGQLAAAWSQVENGYYLWASLQYNQYGAVLIQQNGSIATQPSLTNLTPGTPDASFTYTYNADGQLDTKTVQYAGQSPKVTTYSYDGFGNMSGYTDPFGQTVTASLDQFGRKSNAQSTVQGNVLQEQYAYDSIGRLITIGRTCEIYQGKTLEQSFQDTLSYRYDALLRTTGVASQTSMGADSQLPITGTVTNFAQSLVYDVWGNIIGNTIQFVDQNGKSLGALDQTYAYDAFDQLLEYAVNPNNSTIFPRDANGSAILSQAFAYDTLHNLQSVATTVQNGSASSTDTLLYGYNPSLPFQLEQVTGFDAITYDMLGRTSLDAHGNSISYDPTGYAKTVTLKNGQLSSYAYGPDRSLIKHTASDGTSLYNYFEGGVVTAREDSTGNLSLKTLVGTGDASVFTYYDLLGNAVLSKTYQYSELNGQPSQCVETVLTQNLYSPTGIQTNVAGAHQSAGYPQNIQVTTGQGSALLVNNLTGGGQGYNNEVTDPLTGDQILGGYRAYDPVLGRFNKPDCYAPGGAGINPYAYTSNRFVGCSDPSGHFTYTYQSYNKAKHEIKRAEERNSGFFHDIESTYKGVVMNIINHPLNPSGYVAAAMLYADPTAPITAAAFSQLGRQGAAGAFFDGVYAGVNTAVFSTCTVGLVSFNPQTGLGGLNTAGVGSMLGLLTLGYLSMSPNGRILTHGAPNLESLKKEGYALGDLVENIVTGIVGVGIGLCYDMPMDFAKGEYYEAGYAMGYNTAMLISMVAAPEDSEMADVNTVTGKSAAKSPVGEEYTTKEQFDLPKGAAKAFGKKFTDSLKGNFKPGKSTTGYFGSLGRGLKGRFGSKAVRMAKAGRFGDYVSEFLGGKIGGGLTNVGTYSNLNMPDPRSPWSTAAWQNQLYRQGPYTPDKN